MTVSRRDEERAFLAFEKGAVERVAGLVGALAVRHLAEELRERKAVDRDADTINARRQSRVLLDVGHRQLELSRTGGDHELRLLLTQLDDLLGQGPHHVTQSLGGHGDLTGLRDRGSDKADVGNLKVVGRHRERVALRVEQYARKDGHRGSVLGDRGCLGQNGGQVGLLQGQVHRVFSHGTSVPSVS